MTLFARRYRLSIGFGFLLGLMFTLEITGHLFGWPQSYGALFAYDSQTGLGNPHGRHIRIQSGERIYDLDFDSDGLLDRAGGDPDVIVIGDGAVAGVELQPNERISHLLVQGGLSGSINLSVTGFGTLQEVVALQEALDRLSRRSRTVVLVFNLSNDLIDNIRDWEGTNIPGAWLNAPREILPPNMPSWSYRVLREIYLRSYTLQGLRDLFTRVDASQAGLSIPVPAPCLRGDPAICDRALITSEEAFKRLRYLAEKHHLEIIGLFWDDLEITPYPEEEVAQMARRIEELAPFVRWIGRVGLKVGGGEWANWLAAGTRHANARATRVIADRVLRVMSSEN